MRHVFSELVLRVTQKILCKSREIASAPKISKNNAFFQADYAFFYKFKLTYESKSNIIIPTLRTCFDTFWYFYDKPASRKDPHRIGEIWSCELRFYFPLVFFLVHLKLLTQCRDHAGLRNKYRNRKSEVRSIGL